ncbi:MAG: hypothetical protein AAF495_24545 [Pseudomonadota bacterium]
MDRGQAQRFLIAEGVSAFPRVVTHIYDPRRGPFQNLCSVPTAEAQAVLDQIAATGQRRIKPNYLARRQATEAWLWAERTRKIGPVRRDHPIYFFLGDFADGKDPSRPESILLALDELPPESITFTYSDSMTSFALGTKVEHRAERRAFHGQVFTLDEIEAVVARHGMPEKAPDATRARRAHGYIELQLWDERPLERCLTERHPLSLATGRGRLAG